MAWDYLCCSKGHLYRVKKAHLETSHIACPFCGSTWKFKVTKRKWVAWRGWFFNRIWSKKK